MFGRKTTLSNYYLTLTCIRQVPVSVVILLTMMNCILYFNSLSCDTLPIISTFFSLSRNRIIFFFLIFATVTTDIAAQIPAGGNALDPNKSLTQYIFEEWNTDCGLPSNSILDDEKTSDGYLWFATFDGLVRFDGVNFKIFNQKNYPIFKTDGILTVYEDSRKNLWIGSNGGGLLRYKDGDFTLFQDSLLMKNNIITAVKEDKDGNIWIGTRSGLVKLNNGKFESFDNKNLLDNLNIYTLYFDKENNLWIGTIGNGLIKYKDGKVTSYTSRDGLPSNSIRAILEDKEGRFWLGTDNGVLIKKERAFVPFTQDTFLLDGIINEIIQDKAGTIWFGTDKGLTRYAKGKLTTVPKKLEWGNNTIQTIFPDESGNLWLGTYRYGIVLLKDGKFNNYTPIEGLSHNIVNVTYPEGDRVWVGTHNGLSLIEENEIKNFALGDVTTGNRVRDIIKSHTGELWICTYDGLIKFEDSRIKRKFTIKDGLSSNRLRVIEEDKKGNLWIGTQDGLNLFAHGTFKVFDHTNGLENDFIMSLLSDRKDNLWIGTNGGGIYKYDGKSFETFNTYNGLPSDVIFQMYEDDDGVLWIGTNSGLVRYDQGQFHVFSNKDGLLSNTIFQVIEDNRGDLWLTSNKGVSRISKKILNNIAEGSSDQLPVVRNFSKSDGMIASEITGPSISGKDNKGRLWFSTVKGVSSIDPDNIPVNTVPPLLLIEKLVVNDSVYHKDQAIPAGRHRYEFHYTGLNYKAPNKIRFKYKLENFDREWIDVGTRRTAYYTNVPPGKYTFKVKAANDDGVWNEEGASIEIRKKAYFYQTIWFYFIAACFCFGLGFVIYLYRIRSLRARNKALSQIIDDRTRDIIGQKESIEEQKEELKKINAIKDKLFSIVSHDLRSPLASFSTLLYLISSDNLSQVEFKKLSENLKGNVTHLTNLLDNLLGWAKSQMQGISIKPVHFDLHAVVEEIFEILQAEADKKNIALENWIFTDTPMFADVNMTNLIIRNLVANAIKFTPGGGKVMVSASISDEGMEIEVADTGVGISEENVSRLFNKEHHYSMLGTSNEAGTGLGLLICKEFIDQAGGEIWVESSFGKGSKFKFILSHANINPQYSAH